MATRILSVTTYVVVLLVLAALTILTVGISFVHLPPGWHIAAGLTIAAAKASLVVLIFMHALDSPRPTLCAIVASIVWILIFFSLISADYLTRSMIPSMPGH